MKDQDTGGAAFPSLKFIEEGHSIAGQQLGHFENVEGAVTLRDYFAAKNLYALIVEPCWAEGQTALVIQESEGFKGTAVERYAFVAYKLADAMLAERSKTGG